MWNATEKNEKWDLLLKNPCNKHLWNEPFFYHYCSKFIFDMYALKCFSSSTIGSVEKITFLFTTEN